MPQTKEHISGLVPQIPLPHLQTNQHAHFPPSIHLHLLLTSSSRNQPHVPLAPPSIHQSPYHHTHHTNPPHSHSPSIPFPTPIPHHHYPLTTRSKILIKVNQPECTTTTRQINIFRSCLSLWSSPAVLEDQERYVRYGILALLGKYQPAEEGVVQVR